MQGSGILPVLLEVRSRGGVQSVKSHFREILRYVYSARKAVDKCLEKEAEVVGKAAFSQAYGGSAGGKRGQKQGLW